MWWLFLNENKFKTYDELEDYEKEVLDAFRQIKLISDYNRDRLYSYKLEDLIKDYEQLKQIREEIQAKYFSIYEELLNEEWIEGEIDASLWGITREQENDTWESELRLMSEIKTNIDLAIKIIVSSERE